MPNANYTPVAATASSSLLAPKNTRRSELMITNNSVATLYINFGTGKATPTNFSVALPFGGTFVTAISDQVNGAWASAADGQANITEVY